MAGDSFLDFNYNKNVKGEKSGKDDGTSQKEMERKIELGKMTERARKKWKEKLSWISHRRQKVS